MAKILRTPLPVAGVEGAAGMSRYVQHVSGQGEKWLVNREYPTSWDCTAQPLPATQISLPKSEYCLVEPPEHWEDVTKQVLVSAEQGCTDLLHEGKWLGMAVRPGYRLRKMEIEWFHGGPLSQGKHGWAFIVERRQP